MALLGIDCGKRGLDRNGVGASGWGFWEWGGWSGFGFTVTGPSVNLASAPGYMVILVREATVGTVSFLGFGSWYGGW